MAESELKREAEILRRLADQLESLAEQRRAIRTAARGAPAFLETDLLAGAASRLPASEAQALIDLPHRLRAATRRVRLSAEILAHYLGALSTLLRKAAR